jgi:hypothetical protein
MPSLWGMVIRCQRCESSGGDCTVDRSMGCDRLAETRRLPPFSGRGSSSVGAGAGVPARLELVSNDAKSVGNGGSEVDYIDRRSWTDVHDDDDDIRASSFQLDFFFLFFRRSAPSPESNVGTGRGSSSVGAGAGVPARLELVSNVIGSQRLDGFHRFLPSDSIIFS